MSRVQKREIKVTAAIGTVGNVESLCLTLQSVLCQLKKPDEVIIYNCSEGVLGASFYLNQLMQVGVQWGIKMTMRHLPKIPIDAMYQQMLEDADDHLWMTNDDVLFHPTCLDDLVFAKKSNPEYSMVVGTKPDISNNRNYKNWTRSSRSVEGKTVTPHAFYLDADPSYVFPRYQVDCGNVLIDAVKLKNAKVSFLCTRPGEEYAYIEDWLIGMRCKKAKLKIGVAPAAVAVHLDKPSGPPVGMYSLQKALIRERLKSENLPEDVLNDWGAS